MSVRPEEIAAAKAEHQIYGSQYQTPPWAQLRPDEQESFREHAMLIVAAYLASIDDAALEAMAANAYTTTQRQPWVAAHIPNKGAQENFRRYMKHGVEALLSRALHGNDPLNVRHSEDD